MELSKPKMTSSLLLTLLMTLWWASLISPTNSLTCTSQTFTNKKLYTNCTDLPTLNSYLHYTYNATNSSLHIAFIATPPNKSNGWIAWAINPTATGMIGAQSLIAFKSNNSLSVNTYNLTSYKTITQTKLSFDVWDLKAESNDVDGSVVIFGSLEVGKSVEELNQLWQVGGKVNDGVPAKHAFAPANLQAKAVLRLVEHVASESPAPSPGGGGKDAPVKASVGVLRKSDVGFVFGLVLLLSFVMSF